jgi:hypothetical protein
MSNDWKEKVKERISDEQKEIDQFKNDRKVILDKVTKAVYEVYSLTGVKIRNIYFVSEYIDGHPVKDELYMREVNNAADYCFRVTYEGRTHDFYWHEFHSALNERYKKHSWKGWFVDFY